MHTQSQARWIDSDCFKRSKAVINSITSLIFWPKSSLTTSASYLPLIMHVTQSHVITCNLRLQCTYYWQCEWMRVNVSPAHVWHSVECRVNWILHSLIWLLSDHGRQSTTNVQLKKEMAQMREKWKIAFLACVVRRMWTQQKLIEHSGTLKCIKINIKLNVLGDRTYIECSCFIMTQRPKETE